MTSLEDKFKTEKMDLTVSQQNTLRQEQSQIQREKVLHSDRLTKVTNNTVQLKQGNTFSGHGSYDVEEVGELVRQNLDVNKLGGYLEYKVETATRSPNEAVQNQLVMISHHTSGDELSPAVIKNVDQEFLKD